MGALIQDARLMGAFAGGEIGGSEKAGTVSEGPSTPSDLILIVPTHRNCHSSYWSPLDCDAVLNCPELLEKRYDDERGA